MTKIRRTFILGLTCLGTVLLVSFAAEAKKPATKAKAKTPAADDPYVIPEILNLDQIVHDLNLSEFKDKKSVRKSPIKIAIFDDGFNGYLSELGKRLPAEDHYHNGPPSAADGQTESYHGTIQAILTNQILVKSGVLSPADYELHLFKTRGLAKLRAAVQEVIDEKFDIVLHAVVWEYGGFGDGKGYINATVKKAVDAGIIWINAAGDFGHLTKRAPVKFKREATEDWVEFSSNHNQSEKGVKLVCHNPYAPICPLDLILSWNDYNDDEKIGSDQELDLYLYDSKGKQIDLGDRHQIKTAKTTDEKATRIPKQEIPDPSKNSSGLPKSIPTGTYLVRVKVKTPKTFKDTSELRLVASGDGISFAEPSVDETLLPPADYQPEPGHPGLIVVGASDDPEYSARSKSLGLPKISFKSTVKLADKHKSEPKSTSTASSMAALPLAVLYLAIGTEATPEAILEKLATHVAPSVVPAKAASVVATTTPLRKEQTVKSTTSARTTTPTPVEDKPVRPKPPVPAPVRIQVVKNDLAKTPAEIRKPNRMKPSVPVAPPQHWAGETHPNPNRAERGAPNVCLQPASLHYSPQLNDLIEYLRGVPAFVDHHFVVVVHYEFAQWLAQWWGPVNPGPLTHIFITPIGYQVFSDEELAVRPLEPHFYEVISTPTSVCSELSPR